MTPKEKREAYERYASYRAGWRDGCRSQVMDGRFMIHSRPDLTNAYKDGYSDGQKAWRRYSQLACERYGHVPAVLRVCGDDKDQGMTW